MILLFDRVSSTCYQGRHVISRKNKDGSTVTYVQLAHNARDPQSGQPKANVLHTFGRSDNLDVAAIKRLTKSLCRFLSPEDAVRAQAVSDGTNVLLTFLRSVPLGGRLPPAFSVGDAGPSYSSEGLPER